MQFSTIALLLAALIAPSAAEYVCHSDASFNSDVDTMPSAAAQKYLGSALVDAFNEAYAGVDGVTMDYDDVEEVSNSFYFVMLFPIVVVVAYALTSILSLTKLIHSHS
jgi:succinate dehydrogenase hydrophobic anchor subunit